MRSNLRALYRAGSGSHALLLLDPMIVHSRNVHLADRDLILDEVQVCVQPLQDLGRILWSTGRIDYEQPYESRTGNAQMFAPSDSCSKEPLLLLQGTPASHWPAVQHDQLTVSVRA